MALKQFSRSISGVKTLWTVQVPADSALLHLGKQLSAWVDTSHTSNLMSMQKTHVTTMDKGILNVGDLLHV
jgi:hypothetical protein